MVGPLPLVFTEVADDRPAALSEDFLPSDASCTKMLPQPLSSTTRGFQSSLYSVPCDVIGATATFSMCQARFYVSGEASSDGLVCEDKTRWLESHWFSGLSVGINKPHYTAGMAHRSDLSDVSVSNIRLVLFW